MATLPNASAVLHNAARHYCMSRMASIPPRLAHREVVAAILRCLEQFDPGEFETIEEARQLLCEATRVAGGRDGGAEYVLRAAVAERAAIARFVKESGPDEWSRAPALGYRRLLLPAERTAIYESFASLWGHWYGGFGTGEAPVHQTFHVALMATVTDGPELLWKEVAESGVTRVLEIREAWDRSYEFDVGETYFEPRRSECFWFERSMRWMIYASHEQSVTFGGDWLLDAVRGIFPQAPRYIYTGYDQTFD